MTCLRCKGWLCREKMFDLPAHFEEYFCLNCGERFWVDFRKLNVEISLN